MCTTATVNQSELIQMYEKKLKNTKIFWPTNTKSAVRNMQAQKYIDFAEKELQEVRNGRNY